ncbi:MAG TPA: hypothetical protein VHX66_10095 [Solirubrobacteraceae bacterium]|nr:hypothetical protein [Solirubrobacteraceae bacterium]
MTEPSNEAEAPIPASQPLTIAALLDTTLLSVDGAPFTGRELLSAGIVAGRWQRLERDLAEGLGLIAADPVPKADASEQLRAFRLERALFSAEDVRAWMAPRGLSIGATTAVAARQVARRRGGSPLAVETSEAAAALPAEAICSGALTEIGWWLADRVLSAKATDSDVAPVPLESRHIQRLVWDEVRSVAGRALAEPGTVRGERIGRVVALDAAHREWEASLAGEAELSKRLREHELDWCRYEVEELRLGGGGAAAEVARQLAEGAEAGELARTAGVPLSAFEVILADAPASLVRALTGAVAGEVAGPWAEGDGDHRVLRVRARQAPNPDDAELIARARAELIAEGAARLRSGRVRWHDRC